MKWISWFGMFSVLLIASCTDQEVTLPDMGYNYFPLKVDNYRIYDVSETTIVDNISTKITYELREWVSDSVINSNNTVTYTITRQKRSSSAEAWQNFETWTSTLNSTKLIQNENDVQFVKLMFPPSLNLAWNGNEFNSLENNGNLFNDSKSETYIISAKAVRLSLTTGFDAVNTITVTQNSYDDPITGKDVRLEVYAQNVGLVYKEVTQLKYCTSGGCLGQKLVNSGKIITQSLKSYGAL